MVIAIIPVPYPLNFGGEEGLFPSSDLPDFKFFFGCLNLRIKNYRGLKRTEVFVSTVFFLYLLCQPGYRCLFRNYAGNATGGAVFELFTNLTAVLKSPLVTDAVRAGTSYRFAVRQPHFYESGPPGLILRLVSGSHPSSVTAPAVPMTRQVFGEDRNSTFEDFVHCRFVLPVS